MNSFIPNTVNLHSLIPCNYSCGFCYAGFAGSNRARIPQHELHQIINQVARTPLPPGLDQRKVTFAGGEPLLSQTIAEDLQYAKKLGLATSLVTNGSLLNDELIASIAPNLDLLTISIDSLHQQTNRQIGRALRGITLSPENYLHRIRYAKNFGCHVKINTVVNRLNASEDFSDFMLQAAPDRWKVLQACKIDGENADDFSKWAISEDHFKHFESRHSHLLNEGITVVFETDDMLYGSYAMVAPNGCFFDNSEGIYRYSRPIIEVGIEKAFSEINFSWETFKARGGEYSCTKAGKASR